jgi:hypothetical protein
VYPCACASNQKNLAKSCSELLERGLKDNERILRDTYNIRGRTITEMRGSSISFCSENQNDDLLFFEDKIAGGAISWYP